jgi:UDP-glucose 4-epimerase
MGGVSLDGARVLVTGGAGFIGSHLVDALVKDGCEVCVLDNLSTGRLENMKHHLGNGNVVFVQGDVRDKQAVCEAVKGVESLNLLTNTHLVGVKVKVTREGILIPEELFKEMVSVYVRVEQILATLETLADEEALKTIERSREEVAKGEYVECSINDLEKVLE